MIELNTAYGCMHLKQLKGSDSVYSCGRVSYCGFIKFIKKFAFQWTLFKFYGSTQHWIVYHDSWYSKKFDETMIVYMAFLLAVVCWLI